MGIWKGFMEGSSVSKKCRKISDKRVRVQITNRAEDGMIFVVKFAQAKFRRANIIITIQVNRVRPLLFR